MLIVSVHTYNTGVDKYIEQVQEQLQQDQHIMVITSYVLCSIVVALYLFVVVRVVFKLKKIQFVALILLLISS